MRKREKEKESEREKELKEKRKRSWLSTKLLASSLLQRQICTINEEQEIFSNVRN